MANVIGLARIGIEPDMTPFEKARTAFAAAGAAAGAAIVAGINEAMEQAHVGKVLQAQLGTTDKVAKDQGKIAGRLYSKGVSDSFQAAADAIKSTVQAGLAPPGTTTKQLEQIATKAQDVATVFGQDLGGVTNAVSQMMRTGLVKNSSQAFDVITKGFQAGANKADDLLDTINEYGTQFRKAGVDGQQAMGLISQAIQAGARDSDIAADAIKEFALRAVDGSESTVDGFKALRLSASDMAAKFSRGGKSANAVLDITLDRLRGMKDHTKQAQVATQLFGTQAEDLGAALFAMDPSEATKRLGKFAGSADKLGRTIRSGPMHQIEVFQRTVKQRFVEFLGSIVIPILSRFVEFVKNIPQPVVDAFKGLAVASGVLLAVVAAVGALAAAFAFLATPAGIVVAALAAFALGLKTAWQRSETFRAVVVGVWERVKGAARATVEFFRSRVFPVLLSVWENIKNGAKAVRDAFAPLIVDVVKFFKALAGSGEARKLWQGVVDFIKGRLSDLKSEFRSVRDAIASFWREHGDEIVAITMRVWSTIKTIITVVMKYLPGFISGTLDTIKGLFSVFMGLVTGDFGRFSEGIKKVFTNIWGFITGIFKKLFNWLVGHSLIPDLVKAVLSWFRRLRDGGVQLIVQLKDRIVGTFKRAGSWLLKAGKDLVSGMKSGISGGIRGIRDWLGRNVISPVTGRFKNAYDWLYGKGKSLISGLLGGARERAKSLGKWAGGIKNRVVGAIKSVFGIKSPSTVMAGLGSHMMSGLMRGLLSGRRALDAIVKSMFGGTLDAAKFLLKRGVDVTGFAPWVKGAGSLLGKLFGGFGGRLSGAVTSANQRIGKAMMMARWSAGQWPALRALWMGESGWNHRALNRSSGAFGVPQSLPARKMASAGPDWRTNPATQIRWGLDYIASRYGSPANAYRFWLRQSPHWYDNGGMLPTGLSLVYNGTGRPERVLSPRQEAAMGGEVHYHFHAESGVIGSQHELQKWFVKTTDTLRRQGRLP